MIKLRNRLSFRTFLAIAAMAILLPFLAVVWVILLRNSQLHQHAIDAELRAVTQLATAAIDVDLTEWLVTLERAAASPGMNADDPAGTRRILGNYRAEHPEMRALALLDRGGKPIIQVGDLSDRDISGVADAMALPAAVSGRRSSFSGLLHGWAGKQLIGLAISIRRAELVEGVVLAISQPDEFKVILPPGDVQLGWQAAIVDQSNVVMVHSNPALVGQPSPYPLLQPRPGGVSAIVRRISVAGTAIYVAERQSSVAPWHIVYMAPAAILNRPPLQSVLDWVVLVGLLAMPIIASALLGRYLGRRIEALAEAARLVSIEATPAALARTGLREIDSVQEALQHAAEVARERAIARERIHDMEVALHRRQRVESLGQIAAGIAHDFGNLIFTIRGNLELIKRDLGDDERVPALVDPPLKLADEAAQLIFQLSSGVRHKEHQALRLNVSQVLREVADLLRQVAGRAVTVKIEPESDLFDCRLDPTLLKSALLNLVINARNAMPGGGEIRICSRNLTLTSQGAAATGLTSPGRYVALSVADTGIGIAREICARIFEPFFTTREGEIGMGVGLSILYAFVKSAGGHVVVDSELGVGTTFTMYFPADPPNVSMNHTYAGVGTDADSLGTIESSGPRKGEPL